MERQDCYKGFPPLAEPDEIVARLLNDPPEIRWRVPRELFHIKETKDREALIEKLRPHLLETGDQNVKERLTLALQALHRPLKPEDYILVRGKGALKPSEMEEAETPCPPELFPVVDFHVQPQTPDIKFFSDMREAGVTHAVLAAEDMDPEDIERPEIGSKLEEAYSQCAQASRMPFESLKKHIKANLRSPMRATNRDVADWVADYPAKLVGFGSVNMSKDGEYVEKTLESIREMGLKGVKLFPHSQFFNPSENGNMDLLFEFCADAGMVVMAHCGCGLGPFEILELSRNSHPSNWESCAKRHPDVPLVLSHFGAYSTNVPGIWLYEAMQLGQKHKNVYADLSSADWILDKENVVNEIRKTMTFDRVLFASNYPIPLTSGVTMTYLTSGIKANLHLTEKEKRKVLGENAARLLRIG